VKRKHRITRSIDIKRVRRLGKSYAHPFVVLTVLSSELENTRAGVVAGKSIGNAIKRNRAKRRLRAIFQELLPFFQKPSDVILIAREPINQAAFHDLRIALIKLLTQAQLIDMEANDSGRSTD
jgi:ribonuclease P protein component